MSKNTNLSFLTDYITADITNGRIGINNASPTVAFDVTGVAKFSSSVTAADLIISDTYANDPLIKLATTTSGSVEVQMRTATTTYNAGIGVVTSGYDFGLFTNNTTRMTINSAGNVGIGTSTINEIGANYTTLVLSGSVGGGIRIQKGSVLRGDIYADDGGFNLQPAVGIPLVVYTNNAERMRITSGGNVGIGTTTPNVSGQSSGVRVLTVQGATSWGGIEISNASSPADGLLNGFVGFTNTQLSAGYTMPAYIGCWLSGGGATSGGDMRFHTQPAGTQGGLERMRISSNGNIGAPTGSNIYNASDARLKKNISTTTYGLDAISALNPVKFNWVDGFEPSEDGKDMLGFVAQEVQQVIPEAVEGFGGNSITIADTIIDNPLRVNEKFIIPVLVKAIQELKAEIETLKNK